LCRFIVCWLEEIGFWLLNVCIDVVCCVGVWVGVVGVFVLVLVVGVYCG